MTATLVLTPVDAVAARARHARTWLRWSAALLDGRVADAVGECAADVRLELDEPVGGLPAAVSGRDGLVATWQAVAVAVRRARVVHRGLEQTDDPDVAVAEHVLEVELLDGTTRVLAVRSRVTFGAGGIAAIRDEPRSGLGELVELVLGAASRV